MNVVFRADASLQLGTGHVARCLTLAHALAARGAACSFVCRRLAGGREDLIAAAGFPVVTFEGVADAACSVRALADLASPVDIVVVDHYELGAEWESHLAEATQAHVVAIDDLADRPHACALLIDQNYYRDPVARYAGLLEGDCAMLLGPTHALVRPEFSVARAQGRLRDGSVNRVLVFFGGVDAGGETLRALRAVLAVDLGASVDVVVGRANPKIREIARIAEVNSDVTLHVETSTMASLMAGADLCVGAAGGATWERCTVGLPALVVSVAANQEECMRDMSEAGLLDYLGPSETVDDARLREAVSALANDALRLASYSVRGAEVCDGEGRLRVADAICALR